MAIIFQQEKFIKTFTFVHGKDELLDEDLEFLKLFSDIDDSPLFKIQALKDMGNDLFKQNLFDPAGDCYDRACRLLCYTLKTKSNIGLSAVSEMAISLNLNLAACANKLQAYEAAINFCSMVLYVFPSNVKALFRRGVAHMKLNKLLDARKDFEDALIVDSKNKDVMRELNVVKNLLAINSNGKRSVVDSVVGDDRGGKRPIPPLEESDVNASALSSEEASDCSFRDSYLDAMSSVVVMDTHDHDQVSSSDNAIGPSNSKGVAVMVESVESIVRNPPEEMDTSPCSSSLGSSHEFKIEDPCITDVCSTHSSVSSSPDLEAKSKSNNVQNYLAQKSFHYTKRGGNHPQLQISESCYQKLRGGQVLNFYQKSKMTLMTVRILQPTCSESESCLAHSNASKKRRKRRRRKTKRDNVRPTEVNDATSDHREDSTFPSPIGGQSSVLLDRSLSIKSYPTMSEPDNSHYPQPYVFSSTGPRYKKFQPTTKKMKLNNNQGDESPRCSFSAFSKSRASSRKSLRPRGVSVSCCRYSLMVQPTNKRKYTSSQMLYSERPLKKHFRGVSPSSFLVSSPNNVVLNPDLGCQICIV